MSSLIKQKRTVLGISQRELAEMAGINFRTLQEYEQERKSIQLASAEVVYKLSLALNCNMEDLIISIPKNETADNRIVMYANACVPKEVVGCVNIIIDELVPCLKDVKSGVEEDTVVFKIESRSYLTNFNSKNGWHINWSKIPKEVEVYALALKKNNEIQGLIGLKKDHNNKAIYIHWICTAPHNNIQEYGSQKYLGVGGHLFAIAADISIKCGYDGFFYGFANSKETLSHYTTKLNATPLAIVHPYQFIVDEIAAKKLLEAYNYEWN